MGERKRIRDAITSSARLSQDQKYDEALKSVDEAIAEAIRERWNSWIPTLCHHAAIIANFMGDRQRQKQYYEQSLAFSPGNPRALYGLAKIAEEQGECEIAKQLASRCCKAIVEGDDEIARAGLLDLVIAHWPELASKWRALAGLFGTLQRQRHFELRTFADGAADVDAAAVRLHDAVGQRQP